MLALHSAGHSSSSEWGVPFEVRGACWSAAARTQPQMGIVFVGATEPGLAAQLQAILFPGVTEADLSMSTVGHEATEGGQPPRLWAAMLEGPLGSHRSVLPDLGFEWSRPTRSSRGSTPSRPDPSGHPIPRATRRDGLRDGRMETCAGSAGAGSFPPALIRRRRDQELPQRVLPRRGDGAEKVGERERNPVLTVSFPPPNPAGPEASSTRGQHVPPSCSLRRIRAPVRCNHQRLSGCNGSVHILGHRERGAQAHGEWHCRYTDIGTGNAILVSGGSRLQRVVSTAERAARRGSFNPCDSPGRDGAFSTGPRDPL